MAQANEAIAAKLVASLSKRVTMRRFSFSQPNMRSMMVPVEPRDWITLMIVAARLPLRSDPASRVSRREFHPSAAHRTVRDSLPSYGS